MVTKTFKKTIKNTYIENKSRLFVMGLIVFLGVAFVSGLGTLSNTLTSSIEEYYESSNGLDLIIKSKNPTGFSETEKEKLYTNPLISSIKEVTSIEQDDSRILLSNHEENTFHKIKLLEGRAISSTSEVVIDQANEQNIGEKVLILGEEYTIVGVAASPSYYSLLEKEKSMNGEDINHIYYLDTNYFYKELKYITTDMYIKINPSLVNQNLFSKEYKEDIEKIKKSLEEEDQVILTLEENLSYAITKSYGDKINLIAAIFPVFFIAISCLVIYSTVRRLIEEERSLLGCYRSLGIGKKAIIYKYFLFSFIPCLIGAIGGFFLGIHLLPAVIYPAFAAGFYIPSKTNTMVIAPGILVAIIMLLFIIGITIYTIHTRLKEEPCALLKEKSPIAGKKIFLEYLPFLWRHFSFKYKSAVRNIFRYKANLCMTVLSVSGSTALTFAGFGLYAIAISPNTTEIPSSMADTFSLIACVVILFASALCILVVFNITNMNIQERQKEIATLRVLGYYKKEVNQYIYREINLMGIFGLLLGIPLGYALLNFLFEFLEFGNIKDVSLPYYLITILLVGIFIYLSELLLKKKIHHVDMQVSLKENE